MYLQLFVCALSVASLALVAEGQGHCNSAIADRYAMGFPTQQSCENNGGCWDGSAPDEHKCYEHAPFIGPHDCDIPIGDRDRLHYPTPQACRNNGGCYSYNWGSTRFNRCYERGSGVCTIPPWQRVACPLQTEEGCELLEGCWNATDGICFFRNPHCRDRPCHCDLVSEQNCEYTGSQTCGVTIMQETWHCFASPDYDRNGDYTVVPMHRPCCVERCSPGPGTGPGYGHLCSEVWPYCETGVWW